MWSFIFNFKSNCNCKLVYVLDFWIKVSIINCVLNLITFDLEWAVYGLRSNCLVFISYNWALCIFCNIITDYSKHVTATHSTTVSTVVQLQCTNRTSTHQACKATMHNNNTKGNHSTSYTDNKNNLKSIPL